MREIMIIDGFTLHQLMGLATIVFSIITIIIDAWIIKKHLTSDKEIAKSLRHKYVADIFHMIATLMMGVGALFMMPSEFWQTAYVTRVLVLFAMPYVSYRLYKAIRHAIED